MAARFAFTEAIDDIVDQVRAEQIENYMAGEYPFDEEVEEETPQQRHHRAGYAAMLKMRARRIQKP